MIRTERFSDNCTLHLGRCEDILPGIGRIDSLVSDIPYRFKTSGGGKMRRERKCLEEIIEAGLDEGIDYRVINPLLYNSVVIFCHNDQLHDLLPYLAGGYSRYALLFWEKNNPMPVANKHYLPSIEPYIHAWNKGAHPVGALEDKRRSIRTNNGRSEYDHPTVKPIEVMMKIMRNVNGESVIDPYMGTGTTGIAALRNGKRFVGIEVNEKYFDIACARMEEEMKNTS